MATHLSLDPKLLDVGRSTWPNSWASSNGMRRTTTRPSVPAGDSIFNTGIILQELLQGFSRPKARKDLLEKFAALPMLMPDRTEHVDAAEIDRFSRQSPSRAKIGPIDLYPIHQVSAQTSTPRPSSQRG